MEVHGFPLSDQYRFGTQATALLTEKGYSTDFSWDSPADTPYRMYNPDDEAPNTQIYVENSEGKPVEISKLSEPITQLQKKYVLSRFYFPVEARSDIEEIAKKQLRSEV